MLTVSVSAGYLITTSFNKDPRREHTFPHHQLADSSWLAEGEVMLMATGDSIADGTVTIRNSQGETLVLTIEAASTSGALVQQPLLSVSEPLPAFARTEAGKPSYVVLTIAQQYTNVPVTLTTDAPEYFQLASDNRPVFAPALTLSPSPTGAHVHIRYVAQRQGVHTGHLLIETEYETKTIPLKGRSSGLLPTLRKSPSSVSQAMLPQPTRPMASQAVSSKRWIGALTLMVVAGLTYAGYTNRCQLFPALCTSTPTSQTSSSDVEPVVADEPLKKMAVNKITSKPVKVKELPDPALRTLRTNLPATQTLPIESPKERLAENPRISQKSTPSKQFDKQAIDVTQPNKPKIRSKPPVAATEESDLERALNQ